MTFGERRKRADISLILKDMDLVESAFLVDAQKLNKKRQTQLTKRVNKVLEELYSAHGKGDSEEVEGIIKSIKMPSSKEWYKMVSGLTTSAVKVGILRAHLEVLRLRELYMFAEVDTVAEYGYEVVLPEEARDWLKEYGYEIGVITEDTVLERLRDTLEECLDEGVPMRETKARVAHTVGTWISDFHAETIARTETAKMYNAGRLARWLDGNDGFIEALQYDAIVDRRTTDLCKHLDGKIIAITNEKRVAQMSPPNHFRCRATWLPVSKFEDWKDDFPEDAEPQKGFIFEPPLPKLLKGAKEPLVKPAVPQQDASKITDPFIIRSLNDEDFKKAIGNIQDVGLKLSMIMERAEQMAIKELGIQTIESAMKFTFWGMESASLATFEMFGEEFEAHMTPDMKPDVEALVASIYVAQKVSNDEARKELEKFYEKHASDARFADLIAKFRQREKSDVTEVRMDKALAPTEKTKEQKDLLAIKRPPRTANYKSATGLQKAVEDGENWLQKYVDPKLVPNTPIKLRFKNDLDRAYATGATKEIYFGRWETDFSVVVHESAHVYHWQHKEIMELVNEWFMKRTDHLTKPESSRYGEKVIPDDFLSSYIGRIYGWEERIAKIKNIEGFYGQEVFSMGLQEMAKSPKNFYKLDKEHFMFTYAIMRGLW
jgi:SPP1 gp7 family putative phage head morphogenesis protein